MHHISGVYSISVKLLSGNVFKLFCFKIGMFSSNAVYLISFFFQHYKLFTGVLNSGKRCYINTLFLASWCEYLIFPLPQQSLSPVVQLKTHINEQLFLYLIKKYL